MLLSVRKVPWGWDHPRDAQGHYIALIDHSYIWAHTEWKSGRWEARNEPVESDYREDWYEYTCNAYQLYNEECRTPLSPLCETAAKLALWARANIPPSILRRDLMVPQELLADIPQSNDWLEQCIEKFHGIGITYRQMQEFMLN